MYLQQYVLYLVFSAFATYAEDSYAKWSDVVKNNTVDALPNCERNCVIGVDSQLSCWSYGCVCSEQTPGENLRTGVEYVMACTKNCSSSGSTDADRAVGVIQGLCSATVTSVATVAPTASTSRSSGTATSSTATATPAFNASRVVIIDTPADVYNSLGSSCLRWGLNGCKSSRDTSTSCTAFDTTPAWNGTGMSLRCDRADCICSGANFDRTIQTVYDQVNRYCGITVPTEEHPNNTDFMDLVRMVSQFCSTSGAIEKQWNLKLVGGPHQKGLSSDQKLGLGIGVGLGIPSLALAGVMAFIAVRAARLGKET